MGPRVDRKVRATNDYRQQIFATAGVRRMSTTAGRKIIWDYRSEGRRKQGQTVEHATINHTDRLNG